MYAVLQQTKDSKHTVYDEFYKVGGKKPNDRVWKCKRCGITFNSKIVAKHFHTSKENIQMLDH